MKNTLVTFFLLVGAVVTVSAQKIDHRLQQKIAGNGKRGLNGDIGVYVKNLRTGKKWRCL